VNRRVGNTGENRCFLNTMRHRIAIIIHIILCGAPHFMGFVLVCPAAENQGEISDEMNEGDEADET
jgi:hypothetical protein